MSKPHSPSNPPINHTFLIEYNQESVIKWTFGDGNNAPICKVYINDTVTFQFEYIGPGTSPQLVSALLQINPLEIVDGCPFTECYSICLTNNQTLTVGNERGKWPFWIKFEVQFPNTKLPIELSIPDPELQVGSHG